ncbi:DUF4124 domain-containing protein [Chromobacterium alticapitis]|uniref:DUF4124 domain-containing protein n=1 Tax=Chromobacterium alticapitis TaxID=2073169 RepID=A0A2S5DGQ8_9NEIS|nr:DUF4124 domain-containing protein [Chromobacterium alticapitis]POZ62197.1 hypothetical protein C2I19_10290 [Chromobacterium alticapitis]
MKMLSLVCLMAVCLAAQASVFKCRDAAGGIAYSQQPCPPGSRKLEMASQPFSVVEQDEQARAVAQRYRRDLTDWLGKQDKARQKAAAAADKERRDKRKKWLAEREHCQRLDDKRRALGGRLREAASRKEADRVQARLAKAEDQMQDRACHLYKED